MTRLLTRQSVWIVLLLALAVPAQAQVWPNEPVGFTRVGECSFVVEVCSGWVAPFGSGNLASDPTAPLSPPSVLEYSIGPGQDSGGGDVGHLLSNPAEVYLGFWLWLSDPLIQPGNQLQKVFTVMSEGGPTNTTDLFWMLIQAYPDPTGPFYPVYHLESTTLDNSHLLGYGDPGSWIVGQNNWPGVQITQNVWHRIEFYLKRSLSPTSRDGIAKLWMDGQLILNVTNMNWAGPITRFHFTPAWTGWTIYNIQITNRQRFDHAVVSTCSGCVTPDPIDQDGDGIPDSSDQCPTIPGPGPTGCPPPTDTIAPMPPDQFEVTRQGGPILPPPAPTGPSSGGDAGFMF